MDAGPLASTPCQGFASNHGNIHGSRADVSHVSHLRDDALQRVERASFFTPLWREVCDAISSIGSGCVGIRGVWQ